MMILHLNHCLLQTEWPMLCPYNPPGSSKLFYIPMDPETYKSSFSILESKCYGLTWGSEGKTCWKSLPVKQSDSSNVDEQIRRPGSPQTSTLDSITRQHDNKTQSTVKCTFSTQLYEGANKCKDLSKYDVEQNFPSHYLGANRKRLAFSQSDGVGIRNGRDGSSLSDKLPVLCKSTEVEGGSKIQGNGYVSLTEVCGVLRSNGSQCKQGSIREGKSCANQETGCKDVNVQRLGTSHSVTDFICVRNREGETTTDGYRSGSSNGRHFVNIPGCNQRDETSYSGTSGDTVPISVIGADRVAYKDVMKQFAFGRSIVTDAAAQDKEQLVGTGTVLPLREKIEPKAPDTKPMNLTLECKHPGEIVCHPEKMMCAEVKDDRDRRLLEALDRICNLLHVSPIRSNIEHRGTRGARVCKVSSQADSSIATLESAKLGRCQYREKGERNVLHGQRELEAQQTNDGYPPSCLQRQHDFKICEPSSEQKATARNFGETCQTYSSCKDFGNITGHRFAKSTWEIAGRPGAKEGGRIYEHLPRGGAMDRLGGSEHCPERGKGGAKRAVGENIGDDRAGRFNEKESKESPSALSVTSGLQVQSRGIQVDEGQLGPCPRPHTQDAGCTCPSPQTTNCSAFPVCLDMENITKPKAGKAASWFVPLNDKGISSNSHTCKLKIASCTPFERNHGSSFEHMAMTNDEPMRWKPMTLQEALRLNRPWLLSRSRERVRCLALIHAERRLKVALDEERRRLFAPCSGCTAKMAESGILTPGKQKLPRKRKILRKEAIFRSRLLYERLPEIVKKKKQQQQEEMSRLYRLKALQFTQKVTNRVLGRSKAWE